MGITTEARETRNSWTQMNADQGREDSCPKPEPPRLSNREFVIVSSFELRHSSFTEFICTNRRPEYSSVSLCLCGIHFSTTFDNISISPVIAWRLI